MTGPLDALGWALVHSLWQLALVGLGAALLMQWAGPGRMRTQYWIAWIALAACLALPLATFLHGLAPAPGTFLARPAVPMAFRASVPSQAPAAPSPGLRFTGFLEAHLVWITTAWALGALAMGLRMGGGWLAVESWKRASVPAPAPWSPRFRTLARAMGAGTRVVLRATTRVATPVALGLWRPVVLVPAALFTALPEPYLEALLAHELAHVARLDYLVNMIQNVIEVLCFHHPVVWWLSRRVRTLREHLSDDLAAKAIGEPRRLALALNALDDVRPHLTHLALAARGGPLYERIHHLLRPAAPKDGAPWTLAPFLALVLPLALVAARLNAQDVPPITASPQALALLDGLAVREGVDPQLVRSIAWAESGLDPRARSPQGATGLLQVTPETALKFGAKDLKDPREVDLAGVRYLKHLLARYHGDAARAVAAYDCGEAALDAGSFGPGTVAYRALVLDLLKAKAVQPEAPLTPGQVRGTFREDGDGTWTLDARFRCPGTTLELTVTPEPGEAALQGKSGAVLRMGSTGEPKAGEADVCTEGSPKIRFRMPRGTRVCVKCVLDGGRQSGESHLVLDNAWKTFDFRTQPSPK
jgi:beta-lactamase regulating signal transducer with metallopeptidase domain